MIEWNLPLSRGIVRREKNGGSLIVLELSEAKPMRNYALDSLLFMAIPCEFHIRVSAMLVGHSFGVNLEGLDLRLSRKPRPIFPANRHQRRLISDRTQAREESPANHLVDSLTFAQFNEQTFPKSTDSPTERGRQRRSSDGGAGDAALTVGDFRGVMIRRLDAGEKFGGISGEVVKQGILSWGW